MRSSFSDEKKIKNDSTVKPKSTPVQSQNKTFCYPSTQGVRGHFILGFRLATTAPHTTVRGRAKTQANDGMLVFDHAFCSKPFAIFFCKFRLFCNSHGVYAFVTISQSKASSVEKACDAALPDTPFSFATFSQSTRAECKVMTICWIINGFPTKCNRRICFPSLLLKKIIHKHSNIAMLP